MVKTDKLVEITVAIDSEVGHVGIGDLDYGIWGTQIDRYFDQYGVKGKDNLIKFIRDRAIPEIERLWSKRLTKPLVKEETEIERLAAFLMANYQGEFGKGPKPGEGESAVDMAIRILGKAKQEEE